MAINDNLLTNAVNVAKNSESYYFSFLKIKMLLNNNPSVKRIYLGFSYHNLSSYYNDYIYGSHASEISARYFFILPLSDKWKFIDYNSRNLVIYARNILKYGIKNLYSANKSYLGGYENTAKLTMINKKSIDKRILSQYYTKGRLNTLCDYNILYLDTIIKLCNQMKVELIILNTPLQSYYTSKVPKMYIEKYIEILKINHLHELDYSDLVLNDTCFIADGDHLSVSGAVLFSKAINGRINDNSVGDGTNR